MWQSQTARADERHETKEAPSLCNGCSSKCGLVATTVDGQLWTLRGSDVHPYAKGHICGRGHGLADLRFGELAIVIFYQHAVLHQIDGDGGDPRQRRDRPLHMGAARGTAHAGHIKTLFHKTPPSRYILRHYYKKGGAQSQQQFCPKKGNIPAKAAQNSTDFARRTGNVLNFYKRFYSIFAEFVKGRQILIEMTGDRLYNIIARAGNDSSSKRKRNNL